MKIFVYLFYANNNLQKSLNLNFTSILSRPRGLGWFCLYPNKALRMQLQTLQKKMQVQNNKNNKKAGTSSENLEATK
jgi:hypothetical protein